MTIKMERSHLVHMLKFPADTIDCICSFLFYTFQQCIERNKQKYKNLFSDIQQIETTYLKIYYRINGPFMYTMNILYPLREHKAVHTMLCGQCNNFINICRPTDCFGCKCNYNKYSYI